MRPADAKLAAARANPGRDKAGRCLAGERGRSRAGVDFDWGVCCAVASPLMRSKGCEYNTVFYSGRRRFSVPLIKKREIGGGFIVNAGKKDGHV
jgi:hypothetical protein